MKTLLPLLLFLMLVLPCHGQLEWDKSLHFVGGGLFGLAGAGIAKQASKGNRIWTFAGAVVGSTLIGVAKEAVDAGQRDNGWDNGDLAATVLGGITVGLSIELFSKKDANGRLRGRYSTPAPLPDSGYALGKGRLPALFTLGISGDLSQIRKGP